MTKMSIQQGLRPKGVHTMKKITLTNKIYTQSWKSKACTAIATFALSVSSGAQAQQEISVLNEVPAAIKGLQVDTQVTVTAPETDLELQPKTLFTDAKSTSFEDGTYRDRIVVKFKDGAKIRISAPEVIEESDDFDPPEALPTATAKPRLVFSTPNLEESDRTLMQRYNLNDQKVSDEMQTVNQLLERESIEAWGTLFSRSESELASDRRVAQANLKQEFSDLSNYYSIKLKDESDTLNVLNGLNALDTVEAAYLAPIPEDADLPPTTANFTGNQGYLNRAPGGIDARFAWTKSGGRGNHVRIIDIEQGWNLNHEDLRGRFFSNGIIRGGSSRQHGTAVLGTMIGREDDAGITGIVPRARYGVVSAARQRRGGGSYYSVAEAINVAASRLRTGDVILIEQHAKGPGNASGCNCNCGQYRYIAMEYWQAEYDAIRAATARGIVVVEAAGNGGQNLDHSRYGGRFNPANRDSGAIMVGGGSSTARAPMCWTNYGSRLNLQGWGQNVMTTGYGDIKANGNDDNQWYTRSFSGTSSASPIVAGAVASIQSIRKQRGFEPMRPNRIRALLSSTGTPQASSSKRIGSLPNLRSAVNRIPTQDCVNFDHNRVKARRVNGRWKVVDRNHWIMDFGRSRSDRSEAIKARNIIKHYDLTKMCFIGRPNPSMTYFLVNNRVPQGAFNGEDCISFNRNNLGVRRIGSNWVLTDGNSSMIAFGNKRNEANAALRRVRSLQATKQCFVGRPGPSMRYFRR